MAMARYARPTTAGSALRAPSGRAIQAMAMSARTPATAIARSSRAPTPTRREVMGTTSETRTPTSPAATVAAIAVMGSGIASASPAAPNAASEAPGRFRCQVPELEADQPNRHRSSDAEQPIARKIRWYSLPTRNSPPTERRSPGTIASAATAETRSPSQPIANDTPVRLRVRSDRIPKPNDVARNGRTLTAGASAFETGTPSQAIDRSSRRVGVR